jgi:hypothetical protein
MQSWSNNSIEVFAPGGGVDCAGADGKPKAANAKNIPLVKAIASSDRLLQKGALSLLHCAY